MRVKITLACTECKQRNYNLTKDKKAHPERMEVNKYCKFCRKHTLHKETKYSGDAKDVTKWKKPKRMMFRKRTGSLV